MREGDSGHSHSAEQATMTSDTHKEKASLSTTLVSTAASKHRKEKTSETAHSAILEEKPSTARAKPSRKDRERSGGKRPKKKSIWSKLASVVFKCTWPTESPHPIDVDEGAKTGVSDPSSSRAGLKEVPISEKTKEGEPPKEPEVPTVPTPSAEAAPKPIQTNGELAPIKSGADMAPLESEDSNVVVPPSPTTHVLPEDETAGVTSGAVVPPGSTGVESAEESDESSMLGEDEERKIEEEDEEERLILNGGAGIPIGPDGVPRPLLPPIAPHHAGRKCLVLDLDETLVHSSFKVSHQCSIISGLVKPYPLASISQYNMQTMWYQLKLSTIGTTFMLSNGLESTHF